MLNVFFLQNNIFNHLITILYFSALLFIFSQIHVSNFLIRNIYSNNKIKHFFPNSNGANV